jgi:tetratricopeptide (TPR) repeat protein
MREADMREKNTLFGPAAAACLVLSLGGAAAAQNDYSLFQKYRVLETAVAQAQKSVEQGKLDRAEAGIAKCFESVPDHHSARHVQAQILYKRGNYEGALAAMDQAEAGFRRLTGLLAKFQAEKMLKQMDDAQALTETGAELEAWRAVTVCRQSVANGAVLENSNSINEAKRDTQDRLIRREDAVPAEYTYFAGNCLFKLKRYDEAATRYREAIEAEPGHAGAVNNLVNLLYMARRLEEARAAIEKGEAAGVQVIPGLKKAVLDGLK